VENGWRGLREVGELLEKAGEVGWRSLGEDGILQGFSNQNIGVTLENQ
jgi:hypothetical protein